MPYASRLIGFTGAMRTYSGTGATHNVTLRAGNTSVLSAPLTLSSVAVAEASVATAAIPDETTMYVDFALGASGVSASDMTLLMTVVR
jgi:Flp pilus assembly secretin CpaC